MADNNRLQKKIFNSEQYEFRYFWPDSVVPQGEFLLPINFTFNLPRAHNVIEFEVSAALREAHTPVVSDVSLGVGRSPWGVNGETVARRFHAVLPETKILICIHELLISNLFCQLIQREGNLLVKCVKLAIKNVTPIHIFYIGLSICHLLTKCLIVNQLLIM
jgi:hypothetical protein